MANGTIPSARKPSPWSSNSRTGPLRVNHSRTQALSFAMPSPLDSGPPIRFCPASRTRARRGRDGAVGFPTTACEGLVVGVIIAVENRCPLTPGAEGRALVLGSEPKVHRGRNNPKEFVSVRVAANALGDGLHWDPLAPIGSFPFKPDRGFFSLRLEGGPDPRRGGWGDKRSGPVRLIAKGGQALFRPSCCIATYV